MRHTLFLLTVGMALLLAVSPLAAQNKKDIKGFRDQKNQTLKSFYGDKKNVFDEYRKKRNEQFAKFMESHWQRFAVSPAIPVEKEKQLKPMPIDKKQLEQPPQEIRIAVTSAPADIAPQTQPTPSLPIKQNEQELVKSTFTFYGTPMAVRWGKDLKFSLRSPNAKKVSEAFLKASDVVYNNMYADCLELRKEFALCDWAYLKMCEALADALYGKGSNESVMLQGMILNQSGYAVRFAIHSESKKMALWGYFADDMLGQEHCDIDGKRFYLIRGESAKEMDICNAPYEGEMPFSLQIKELPKLAKKATPQRTLASDDAVLSATLSVNQNLIDFMSDYPIEPYHGKNTLTRFAYYGNTPVSDEVRQSLYPVLKAKLNGMPQLQAANLLLNWVQMTFEYQFDDQVWGYDRSFFAEETLFYPYSDCEDHAILFSHLVRDLLGLDVVLVYFPYHLATAVHFDQEVKGAYLEIDGKRYMAADPTFQGAPVGIVAKQADIETAKVIRLAR